MFLIAAVGFLLAAGPGPWSSSGPVYPAIDLIRIAPDDENVVYAGAHDPASGKSALFRSSDGGTNWKTVADAPTGETLTDFAIDPTGPERMLALTKSADRLHNQIYRSDDGGASWRGVSAYISSDEGHVFFDPLFPNTAYLFAGRLQRSEDSGPWVIVEFPELMNSVWISPAGKLFWSALVPPDPRLPFFPPQWEIFTSSTQGRRSSVVPAYVSCPDVDSVVFAPSDPQIAYAISTTCAPFVKSSDGGATWGSLASTNLTNWLGGIFRKAEQLAIDPADVSDVFVTLGSVAENAGLLLQSEDGGRNWNPIPVPATPAGPIAFSPSGRFLYVGTDAGVYRLSLTGTRALPPRN